MLCKELISFLVHSFLKSMFGQFRQTRHGCFDNFLFHWWLFDQSISALMNLKPSSSHFYYYYWLQQYVLFAICLTVTAIMCKILAKENGILSMKRTMWGKHFLMKSRWLINLLVLKRTHISSNTSFNKLENFEFEHISSSWKVILFILSLSLAAFWLEYFECFNF